MHRLILIFSFIVVSIAAKSQSDVQRLYSCIDKHFWLIDDAVIEFNKAIELYDGDTILAVYKKMLEVTEQAIAEVENVKVPAGGESYHKSALELFRFYLRTYEEDYYSAVAILFSPGISDSDIAEVERIFDRVELKESMYLNAMIREEADFCEKFNVMEE